MRAHTLTKNAHKKAKWSFYSVLPQSLSPRDHSKVSSGGLTGHFETTNLPKKLCKKAMRRKKKKKEKTSVDKQK